MKGLSRVTCVVCMRYAHAVSNSKEYDMLISDMPTPHTIKMNLFDKETDKRFDYTQNIFQNGAIKLFLQLKLCLPKDERRIRIDAGLV